MKNKKIKTLFTELSKRPDILEFLKSYKSMEGIFDLKTSIVKERVKKYKNYYVGIGKSDIYRVPLENNNFLHIKMEYSNSQGNSHYSRLWIPYLFVAETLGLIQPNKSKLLEITSGSSGIALSIAAKCFDYNLTMIVPNMLPNGRIEPMEYYGAELIKVDGYIDSCINVLKSKLNDPNMDYFAPNHSDESSNFILHIFKRIAKEYYDRFPIPDYAILGLGNGTSVLSVAKELKRASEEIKIISYHPSASDNNIVLGLLSKNLNMRHIEPAKLISNKVELTKISSVRKARVLFRHDSEISNLGHSSLYAIYIASQIAKNVTGKTFFTIGYDKIDRYKN